MDLTKILNPNQLSPTLAPVSLVEQGEVFFANLISQLNTDLQFLQMQPKSPQYDYFNKIRVLSGNFDENLKKTTRALKNIEKKYFFIQLPNVPGFLIESAKDSEIYKMYRATKVKPILNTQTGESVRPELFILKSKELEEFRILDDCFVRTSSSDRTLSVKQMSEMILLLAESVR
ncbi:MAG: hypothetical protein V4591_02900 [Bdellovibrionota bacterium]